MNTADVTAVTAPALPEIYASPVHTVTVEFGDCDPAAIVFYPNYFRWFDQATWRLFARAGYTAEVLAEQFDLLGHPLVKTGSEFMIPAKQGTTLGIESRILRWGRTSFQIGHQCRGPCGGIYARGEETRIWAGHGTDDKPITALPVPDEVKARLPAMGWD